MQAKLTLELYQHFTQRAKRFAEASSKSVSALVEDYLAQLGQFDEDELPPLTRSLSGILEGALDKAEYHHRLEKKKPSSSPRQRPSL